MEDLRSANHLYRILPHSFRSLTTLQSASIEVYVYTVEASSGLNKESLSAIENALEIIFLDDEERDYDEVKSSYFQK